MSSPSIDSLTRLADTHFIRVEVFKRGKFVSIDYEEGWQLSAIAKFLANVMKNKFVELGERQLLFRFINPNANTIQCTSLKPLEIFVFRYSSV